MRCEFSSAEIANKMEYDKPLCPVGNLIEYVEIPMESKEKNIVFKVEDGMDPQDVYCTTYQMRNFYMQFKDGFFSNLDVMNYIQHHAAALKAKSGIKVLDVCCGRSLMLPLLRYYAKDIEEYNGVDISEANIREAKRGASDKKLTEDMLEDYYPFKTHWYNADVSEMSKVIPYGTKYGLIIYTSALEHMHKDVGFQSLKECHKLINDQGIMFLSCPNTPGNGYNTQYAAHVYEWGYDELLEALNDIGFEIIQEVGLVMSAKEMDAFYNSNAVNDHVKLFYQNLKNYLPTAWLTSIMGIPYPKASKEILFIVRKKTMRKLF